MRRVDVNDTGCQVLVFRMGGAYACVDLNSVERTISLVAMQPAPGSAAYVAGIMNYAGISLPVVDLAIRLGLPSSAYTLDTPIVICVHEDKRIALIVEDIVGIDELKVGDLQLAREFSRYGSAFLASAHTGSGLALQLEPGWLTEVALYPDEDEL